MHEVPGTPSIGWRDAAVGAVIGIVMAELVGVGIASVIAVAIGGFIAARLSGHHGLLQGGAAAGIFIVVVGLVDAFLPAPRLPADTGLLIVLDVAHLLAGTAGGWLALRS